MKSVAVVGASGAVGEVMIRLLIERKFPISSIKFLASQRSAGKSITFAGEAYPIQPLTAEAFRGVDIVLSSTPASVSREFSPIAARAGAVVVDNSSAWRMDPNVPLVVPEAGRVCLFAQDFAGDVPEFVPLSFIRTVRNLIACLDNEIRLELADSL